MRAERTNFVEAWWKFARELQFDFRSSPSLTEPWPYFEIFSAHIDADVALQKVFGDTVNHGYKGHSDIEDSFPGSDTGNQCFLAYNVHRIKWTKLLGSKRPLYPRFTVLATRKICEDFTSSLHYEYSFLTRTGRPQFRLLGDGLTEVLSDFLSNKCRW